MKFTWSVLSLLVLCLWVGGIVLFTFVATPAVFRSFNRDLAGEIVGRMFPPYFAYLFALSVAALALHFLSGSASSPREWVRASLLIAAVLINGYTLFKLHPDMVAVKRQIASFEQEPKDSPMRKRFSRYHAVSAVLNLLVLADGTALLIMQAARK